MERQRDERESGGVGRRATLMAAALATVSVLAMVVIWRYRAADVAEPAAPVERAGWSGQAILCSYREEPDPLRELDAGAVATLGEQPADLLDRAECRTLPGAGTEGRAPDLTEGREHFVLNTGRDRFEVALVGVDVSGDKPSLEAEVTVEGPGCGVTAEYRGQLMLLIEGPAGAATPEVELREVELGC